MLYEVITSFGDSVTLAPHRDHPPHGLFRNGRDREGGERGNFHRITSYNVCYTKLLRQNILKALKREFADWAYERALEILTASNAQEALALLAERGRETVIAVSDLKMPGMKGSDLLS